MPETFTLSELVIPGTYVRVSAEGLIAPSAISTGNIGIVGTAAEGLNETHIFSDFGTARDTMGAYDAFSAGTLNLSRGTEILYRNGARTVFAFGVAADATQADFTAAFEELIKDDVNILVAPELSTEDALSALGSVVTTAQAAKRDVIAVIGTDETGVSEILDQVVASPRIVFTAPGIQAFDAAAAEPVRLPGTYAAAAVAGLLSTLAPQASPTNKVLPGVVRLPQRFSYGQTEQLLNGGVLVLEQRQGVRVVRGITTDSGAFRQITTRRIVDFAKGGIRDVGDKFVGKLNNQRVRSALHGALDGFLTSMTLDEQLTDYNLEVTATRQDEIAGRVMVNAVLQPTFSMDYVAVTMVLQ